MPTSDGGQQSRRIFMRTALVLTISTLVAIAAVGVWFESWVRQALQRDREFLAESIATAVAMRVGPLWADDDYDGIAHSLDTIAVKTGAVDLLLADGSGHVLARVLRTPSSGDSQVVFREASAGGVVVVPRGEGEGGGTARPLNGQLQVWARVDADNVDGWVRASMPMTPLLAELDRFERTALTAAATSGAVLVVLLMLPLLGAYRQVERHESVLLAERDELHHAVFHDRLTGLCNRPGLMERLERALTGRRAGDSLLAVCFLDLDGFKAVNDRYGHAVGDLLLVEVARRLSACVRQTDTVARLAGDEFVLLLEGESRPGEVMAIVEGIIARVSQRIPAAGEPLRVGVSIGVALRQSDHDTAESLLTHADEAMYEAKRGGRNRWVLHRSASGLLFGARGL